MSASTEKRPKKDRHERLMQARIELNKAKNSLTDAATDRVIEAADYLFYELDLLVHEVEELREQLKPKHANTPSPYVMWLAEERTALQTALAEARERLRECQSRLVEVLLQQSINATAETRRRLFESENIPAELWEMRLR